MAMAKPTDREIRKHFRKVDPVIYDLIEQVGPFTLQHNPDRFSMLIRSIISQQLSTRVAQTIRLRVEAAIGSSRFTPELLKPFDKAALRQLGLSNQKAEYILDLTQKVSEGSLALSRLGRKSDEEIIESLVEVRGIGRWTAQMFLIFSMGRLDVFPPDDLGIRTAIRNLYRLEALPDKTTSCQIAEAWKPLASVATWYCWRSLEFAKKPVN